MAFLEPQHTGRRSHMTASTATAVSSPHSDYFGQASHSGSTALTSPSLDAPSPLGKQASFHSLQDIQEAIESNPLGLGPPPGATPLGFAEYAPSPEPAYYSPSSSSHLPGPPAGIANDASIYAALNAYAALGATAQGPVDPMYADDDPDDPAAADLHRGPSVKSRASQYEASISSHSQSGSYVGLGISLEAPPRSPSVMSGRRSPSRFPSNPDRPGSPMRLPASPGLGSVSPSRARAPPRSPQRLPPSPSPGHLSPAPPSTHSQRSGSPLRLPLPPASPCHSPRAPSPLSLSSTVPEEEPVLTPRALPQPPQPQGFQQYQPPSTPPSASRSRRVPVPATAPPADMGPALRRGPGSTKRMVAAWETNAPATPPRGARPLPNPVSAPPLGGSPQRARGEVPTSPSRRRLSQKYLDHKPLPIPSARPIPASASMPWPPPQNARSSAGGVQMPQMPSPVGIGNSPRSRKGTPSTSPIKALSPSSWSPFARKSKERSGEVDTPIRSPNKITGSPLKRSPFQEIKNVFSGLRKGKGKDKDERPTGWGTAMVGVNGDKPHQFLNLEDDGGWFAAPLRHPAVIDRMGDAEMALPRMKEESDSIRSSAALYLAPVPGSTQWGSWMTAWVTLSRQALAITYVPVYQPSPRRGPLYDAIQPPAPHSRPDDDLSMRECVEVRSLRKDEIRGRGIPSVPEGGGSEVLELVFAHGLKRYLAVHGVAGRLGWVSAIWDVLLACKQEPGAKLSLPPPSPSLHSLAQFNDGSLRGRFSDLQDQPVQKFGDTWVASGTLPPGSAGNTPELESAPRLLGATSMFPDNAEVMHFQPAPINPQLTGGPATAAALEDMAAQDDASDLPPPPPPKSRPRSTLIEERMRAFGTPQRDRVPLQVHTEPVKTTAPLRLHKQTPPGLNRRENSAATLRTQETAATLGTAGLPVDSSQHGSSPRGARPRAPTYESATPTAGASSSSSTPLRESSLRMFNADEPRRSTKMEDRIRAWQPRPEDSPPLSRAGSGRSGHTELSFDPSDLNPSRSASQVRPRAARDQVDLASVDAGLARLPAVAELSRGVGGVGGPRSPVRKAVPKFDSADAVVPEKLVSKAETKAEPQPEPVVERTIPSPELEAVRSAEKTPPKPMETPPRPAPASPKTTPGRLNARMLAAAAVFEPSIVDRVGSASKASSARSPPWRNSAPSLRKSPSIKAPVARASPSIATLELLTSSRSDVSAAPEGKAKSATSDTPSKSNAKSTVSASSASVRERIEALSRASEASPPRPPLRLADGVMSPVDKAQPSLNLREREAGSEHRDVPLSPRKDSARPTLPETQPPSQERGSALRSPPPVTAPLALKRGAPQSSTRTAAAPLSPPKRRQLFVTNPGPDSPEPQPRPRFSDVSALTVSATPRSAVAPLPAEIAPTATVTAESPAITTLVNGKATSRGLATSNIDYADDSADDASALTTMTKYTTERESINGVLAEYAATPSTMARSTLSSVVQPCAVAVGTSVPSSVRNLSPTSTGTDPTVLAALDTHTAEHGTLSKQLDDVQFGVNALAASVGSVSALVHGREERDADLALPERLDALNDGLAGIHAAVATLPPDLAQRITALGTDLRGVQMVLYESSAQIAALSAKEGASDVDTEKELPPPPGEAAEPALPEINAKLDALAVLIQEVLARQDAVAAALSAGAGAAVGAAVGAGAKKDEDAKVAPDLPKDAPKDAAKETPQEAGEAPAPAPAPVDAATAAQLAEVQASVAKLGEERALQTQQTADIAKYLSDLNGWLEKFVTNSGSELAGMNTRMDAILKAGEGEDGPSGAIADMHRKLDEAAAREAPVVAGGGGVQAERLDALVALMGEERERAAQQSTVVEHVVQLIEKQRQDNEILLRAVATDLSSEIRGERVRFIEAMREATTMNMQIHVDEFKKALTNEVSQSMRELGTLREQKKALEHRIADLFALIAKHGEEGRMPVGLLASPPANVVPPPSPGGPRALPMPPQ